MNCSNCRAPIDAQMTHCQKCYTQALQQRGLDRVWQGKYGQGQPTYTPVAEKTAGAFPGAIYEKTKTNPKPHNPEVKRWLGKVGSYDREDRGDTLNSASAARRGHGRDAVKEKIAADCYLALAQLTGNAFLVPKCRLAHLPVINDYTKNNPQAQAIRNQATRGGAAPDRQIHIMSKWVEGYRDIKDAFVLNRQGERKPFMVHLQSNELLSNTLIHNNQPIPLQGLEELLAIGRLLMDIDVLGDSCANAGYIMYKNPQGQPIANIVKVDPGYAFSYDSPQNLLRNLCIYNSQNPKPRRAPPRLDQQEDLQLGANGLTLRWQQLDPNQQARFLQTLMTGIIILNDSTVLTYLLNRNGAWNIGAREGEDLLKSSVIEEYCEILKDNLVEQKNIYESHWQRLKSLIIPKPLAPFDLPDIDIPPDYLCPITQELMRDPVVLLDDGETYEREAIEKYLNETRSAKSPRTGKPLRYRQTKPNQDIKRLIEDFVKQHPSLIAQNRMTPSVDLCVAQEIAKQQEEIEQEKHHRRRPFFQYQDYLNAYLHQRGALNQRQGEHNHDVFISYAWEVQDKRNLTAHRKLQAFLQRVQRDLQGLGLTVFLDTSDMARDMREVMQKSIQQSGIILSICKPFLKRIVREKPQGNIGLEINCAIAREQQEEGSVLPLLLEGEWADAVPAPLQPHTSPAQSQDIRPVYTTFDRDALFSEDYLQWMVTQLIPRILNNLGLSSRTDKWFLSLTTWFNQERTQQSLPNREQLTPNDQYTHCFPRDTQPQRTEKRLQAFAFFLYRLRELNTYREKVKIRNAPARETTVLLIYPPITPTNPANQPSDAAQWLTQFKQHLTLAGLHPLSWTGDAPLPAPLPNAVIAICSPALKEMAQAGLTNASPQSPWVHLQSHLAKPGVTCYPLLYEGSTRESVPNWKATYKDEWQKDFLVRNTEKKSLAFSELHYYDMMTSLRPKGLLRDLLGYADNDTCYAFLHTHLHQLLGGWGMAECLPTLAEEEPPPAPESPRPIPLPPIDIDPEQLQQLLNNVARGKQNEAEALLKQTAFKGLSSLGLGYGTVTDYSGRTFEGITAFQYALWAKDWHMWRMVMRYLPKTAIYTQVCELRDKKPPAKRWIDHHGQYFDLQPLANALQTYVDNYDKWGGTQRANYFVNTIGRLQALVPAHVVNEYCSPDRPFYPLPDFRADTELSRTGKVDEDKNGVGTEFWFSGFYDGGKIGKKWAIWRGSRRAAALTRDILNFHNTRTGNDQLAVQSMSTVRTQQLNELVSEVTKSSFIQSAPPHSHRAR